MRMLVIGASAGLGRALAEFLAERGHQLLLVASDVRDLDATAADLRQRFEVKINVLACRIESGNDWLRQIADASAELKQIDAVFFPIGLSMNDDRGLLDDAKTRAVLEANLMSVILITSQLLPSMIQRRSGHIVGFGSIAAIRGRGTNVIYSAAKRALLSYFESLRHITAQTGVTVQFYQLGYLDTQQAFGKKLLLPKADPRMAAKYVVDHLGRDFGVRYYPSFWGLIASVLRLVPWPLFRRLRF